MTTVYSSSFLSPDTSLNSNRVGDNSDAVYRQVNSTTTHRIANQSPLVLDGAYTVNGTVKVDDTMLIRNGEYRGNGLFKGTGEFRIEEDQ
jgi:hypothetical protein